MKILVLGGTGAMGTHLVQLLAKKGDDIVVTSRAPRNPNGKIRFVQGDASDLAFVKPLLAEKWDAVIDFMVYSTPVFSERIDLLLAATQQYVFLSSARVYAASGQPITETSPRLLDVSNDQEFLATDEYSLTKARQEDLLLQSGSKNWTVIRPYITYSEARLQLGVLEKEEWLYRALKGRAIVFSSDICSRYTTMTYGLDVSAAISSVIGNKNSFGEIFHITGPDSWLWNDILTLYLDILEEHLGTRPKVILQDLKTFLEFKPAKYQVSYDRLYDRKFDNSKINRFIDANEFINIREGLTNCLNEFLKQPVFLDINWKSEGIKDRQAGELTPLAEIPGIFKKMKYLKGRYFR